MLFKTNMSHVLWGEAHTVAHGNERHRQIYYNHMLGRLCFIAEYTYYHIKQVHNYTSHLHIIDMLSLKQI